MFTWSERQLCALRPMSKGGHAIQALRLRPSSPDHTIIMFGGSDAYGVSYNDVIAVEPPPVDATTTTSDASSWRCTELQPTNSGIISQRMGHSSVKVPTSLVLTPPTSLPPSAQTDDVEGPSESDWSVESMVVFGGYQAVPDMIVHDDLYAIAVHSRWSEVIGTWKAPPLLRVERVQTIGAVSPSARHSHASCTNTAGTSMFVMGGSGTEGGVLRDCFEFSFVHKLWQEITLPGLGIPREMVSAVCFGKRKYADTATTSSTSHIAVYGGRDVLGQLSSDVTLLHHYNNNDAASATAVSLDVVPQDISQGAPLCCHTTLQLAPWVALTVGGLSSMGPPPFDTLMVANEEGTTARCVPIPRSIRNSSSGEITPAPAGLFGFGHSSCSWQPSSGGPSRYVVVSGLTPDAASGTLEVFELLFQR